MDYPAQRIETQQLIFGGASGQKERKERSGSGTDPHLVKSHLIFAPSLIFPFNYSCPLYCKVLIYSSRLDVRVVLMDDVLAVVPPLPLFFSSPPLLLCRLLPRDIFSARRNNLGHATNPGPLIPESCRSRINLQRNFPGFFCVFVFFSPVWAQKCFMASLGWRLGLLEMTERSAAARSFELFSAPSWLLVCHVVCVATAICHPAEVEGPL